MKELFIQEPLNQMSIHYPEYVQTPDMRDSYYVFTVDFLHMALAIDFYIYASKVCTQRDFSINNNFLSDGIDEQRSQGIMRVNINIPALDRRHKYRKMEDVTYQAGNILQTWESNFDREFNVKTIPLNPGMSEQ